jgi:hypothetical protein
MIYTTQKKLGINLLEVMSMKKNVLRTTVISAVAGCLLLSFSITSFATSGSGYEKYKEAIKATVLTKNATVSTQFELKDNGAVILTGKSEQKIDNENMYSKSNTTVEGVSKTYETSSVNGNYVTNADGVYYTSNRNGKKDGRDKEENLTSSSSTVKLAEMVTDTLVGDVKNQFVSDGNNISVKLEGAQIPELVKLAVSAAEENINNKGEFKGNEDKGTDVKSILEKMPKLSNVDVKAIDMTANVDGNAIKDNKITLTITGQDATGASHEISAIITANITEVGTTKVDSIDTTGKEVKTIDKTERFKNR